AHPVLYVEAGLAAALRDVDMAEICITSQLDVIEGAAPAEAFALSEIKGAGVVFRKADGRKCQRCWKILPDVGSDADYPDLSARDADAVRWYLEHRKAA